MDFSFNVKTGASSLLDQHGNPMNGLALSTQSQVQIEPKRKGSQFSDSGAISSGFSSYFAALYGIDQQAVLRAMSPFENHAWVYAGAMAIALNISQATFNVYNETEKVLTKRKEAAIKRGRVWLGAPAGNRRQAIRRYLMKSNRRQGVPFAPDEVENDTEHPLMSVIAKPNDFMTETQLWQATALWQTLKGSCMWVLLSESGLPLGNNEIPSSILPLPPTFFRPVIVGNELIAWRYRVPIGLGNGHSGATIYLQPNEVIQFKFFNEADFIMGFAPIASSASAIVQDLLAVEQNKAMLTNGADPGGVLYAENGFEDDEEEDKFMKKWEQRHKGTANKNRTAVITGGVKYIQTGLSPQDMQWVEMRKWDREEILAVMGVPKTCVGVTDDIVYATQMAQDKNFWDKRLFPMLRNEEDVIDGSLLYGEPDSVFAGFDVSGIESLRTGYDAKINQMNILCGPNIHMPPKQAAEVTGLDLPAFDGDDIALVAPTLRPAKDVIADSSRISDLMLPGVPGGTGPDAAQPGSPKPGTKPPTDVPDSSGEPKTPPAGTGGDNAKRIRAIQLLLSYKNKAAFWQKYVLELHYPVEVTLRIAWRKAVSAMRAANLSLFDRSVHIDGNKSTFVKVSDSFNLDNVILPSAELQALLKNQFEPVYVESIQKINDFMVEELGGLNVFSVDSEAARAAVASRETLLLGTVPETIQGLLRSSLEEGIKAGETIQQLRTRVLNAYESASQSKSLQIARTEASGFISDVRSRIFDAEGIETTEWVTAGDELVRDTHKTYGASGPHPLKFNYLTLTGGSGILQYPGDARASAEEVVSCRCVEIAAS